MLDFLYKCRPTVQRVLSGGQNLYANLSVVGSGGRTDYVEVHLNKTGGITSVESYAHLGRDGNSMVAYRPNSRNSLFFSAKPLTVSVTPSLRSCRKFKNELMEYLPSNSVVLDVMCRLETALSNEDFCSNLAVCCRTQKIEITNTVGFFINGDDVDVFSSDSLKELDDAISSFKLADENNIGFDIFGDFGPINLSPSAAVNVARIGLVSIYGRNKGSKSDQAYGKLSVECCPVTVKNAIELRSTFVSLTNSEISGNTSIATSMDGKKNLILVCPVGFKSSAKSAIQQAGSFCHYIVKPNNKLNNKQNQATVNPEPVEIGLSEFRHVSEKISSAIQGLLTPALAGSKFEIGVFTKHASSSSHFVSADLDLSIAAMKLSEQIESWGDLIEQSGILSLFRSSFQPLTLHPFEVVQLVNCEWERRAGIEGKNVSLDLIKVYRGETKNGKKKPRPISIADVLRLLLCDDPEVAHRIFDILSRHHIHLFRDVGNRINLRKYSPEHPLCLSCGREDVLRLPLLIGLCYGKLGGKVSEIPNQVPFMIGQLCRLVSEAQALYHCRKENARIPSKMVGDEYFGLFLSGHSLELSYERMINRCRPYIEYMRRKRFQDLTPDGNLPEGKRKSHILLFTFEKLNNRIISAGGLPASLSSRDRSLLALGYTSSPRKPVLSGETLSKGKTDER